MSQKDSLQKFIFTDCNVRGQLLRMNKSIGVILAQRDYPEILRKFLSELLAASAMLSASIKFDGKVTLQIQGDGPVSLMLAQCDNRQRLRGLAKWQDLPDSQQSLQELFGAADLLISIATNKKVSNYQAVVKLTGTSISDAIEEYFNTSEQLPTKIIFASPFMQHSEPGIQNDLVGIFLQVIPTETNYEKESWLSIINELEQGLERTDLQKENNLVVLHNIFPEHELRAFDEQPIAFYCQCSVERSKNTLKTMPKSEVDSLLAKHKIITVTCDFCNKKYEFDAEDLK
ncbi:MAG: Hsp33 family molecular chaperone HslO [Gammaproteobacteria bacterium]|nr:Hsp33 family molecular chaperone HslO [Gammaproteobacteria bacterium]